MNKLNQQSNFEKINHIRSFIKDEELKLYQKYPILKYQNLIGLSISTLAIIGIIICAYSFYIQIIPAWLCIFIIAFLTSFLHELEHDLIHFQYFKDNILVQNIMMLGVWLFRGNMFNPWMRRKVHFHHHKVSGNVDDSEERLIGNGMKYGLVRILIMIDAALAGLIFKSKFNDLRSYNANYVQFLGGFPIGFIFYGVWYAFIILNISEFVSFNFFSSSLSLPIYIQGNFLPILNFIVVVNIIPNVFRQACLNFITSNMHYYGDVIDLMNETQVLNIWFLLPLQFFCCDFGSTHTIHHFVPNQPFYIRYLVRKKAHIVMKENGIRFNDLGTFKRANRYF